MEDNTDLIAHECDFCEEIIKSPREMAGEEVICPNCDESIFVPFEEDSHEENAYEDEGKEFKPSQTLLFDSDAQQLTHSPYRRKRGWLKNLVAILIGIAIGVFLRVIIGIPLILIFATDEGLPLDITFMLEVFTAFVAGAMAGSLVPCLGWLVGALTQLLKMVVTLVVLGLWIFFVVSEKDVDFSLNLIRVPFIRLMIVAILVAGIGGALGEKHRNSIWNFLRACFGFIAAIFVFALHAVGWLLYLYFLYRGGKALFEEGAFLKAMLWVLVIGPVVSYGSFFLLLGIAMGGGWIFKKIYNWYLPDLGFEKMEDWY